MDTAEVGRQLEQRMAGFFQSHGYAVRCNEVVEGRSGGRHEVDVLAELSDALTTYRVAIECKAWQQPIEKDVVSKLHYVLGDLGLHKGIVVSLAGCRSGAERAAPDLGIELWGPDELRRHLGDAAVGELGAAPSTTPLGPGNASVGWGYPSRIDPSQADRLLQSVGRGRFGIRTTERLVWSSAVWVPAYCVRLTVAQPQTRRFKTTLRSTRVDNLYEALGGSCLGQVRVTWEEVVIDQGAALSPVLRDTKVHAAVRRAVEGYERVTSPTARARHATAVADLGLPLPCSAVSVDDTTLVHLPVFVGILDADDSQRAVVVTGHTGMVSEKLSEVLTANLALLRKQVTR